MFKYRKFLTCFIRGYTMGIFVLCSHRTTAHPSSFYFWIGLKCLAFVWMSSDLYTAWTRAQSLQSSPTLRDSTDCNLPGSSVHEIFPAKILEWVAISSSRGSSWPRYQTLISCLTGEFCTTEPPGKLIVPATANKNNNRSRYLLNIYYVLGTLLSTLHVLSHLILNKVYNIICSTLHTEIEAERLNNLPK